MFVDSIVSRFCMCLECNKNVVQCLLHFINLETNFQSVCVRALAPVDSHTRTFSFPLVHDGYDACVLVLHLLFVMVDRLVGWIGRLLMTDTNDNTMGCNTNYRQIEWKYLRCRLFFVVAVFTSCRFVSLFQRLLLLLLNMLNSIRFRCAHSGIPYAN